MSNQVKKALSLMGLRVKGDKVSIGSMREAFGGTFVEPEWVSMNDYKVKMPFEYTKMIQIEDFKIGRVTSDASFCITRYGIFLDEYGNEVVLDGLVYQYSMAKNPRNVHYAYRLFLDGNTMHKNSDLPSVQAAKQECTNQAEDLIKTELYDIS